MAQLNSPGVSVSVIDESFYTTAAPGTVPLIFVASAENKQNSAGTGTANGTEKVNAGHVYLLTSQKELSDTFGTPIFKTDANNNPIHAGEQNEYGLQAAYSYLGVSNRAYVVRADIDLAQLNATATEPTGAPADGTYWFDTANTKFGIFEWNSAAVTASGQVFTNKIPTVITDTTQVVDFEGEDYTPVSSIGKVGDYALVAVTNLYKLWFKKAKTDTDAGTWVEVGTAEWVASWPTVSAPANVFDSTLANNDITINGQALNDNADLTGLVSAVNGNSTLTGLGITAANINGKLALYSTGTNITVSGPLAGSSKLNITGTFKVPALQISSHTSVPAFKSTADDRPTGSLWIKTTTPNLGASWSVKRYNSATSSWEVKSAPLYHNNAAALAGLDRTGGGYNLALGSTYVRYDEAAGANPEANFKIYARSAGGSTVITSYKVLDNAFTNGQTFTFTLGETVEGSETLLVHDEISFTGTGSLAADLNTMAGAINALVDSNIEATVTSANLLVIKHLLGGDIVFTDGTHTPIAKLFSQEVNAVTVYVSNLTVDPTAEYDYVASLWISQVNDASFVEASATALTAEPADGRLWFNSITDEVDIMINDGTNWVGYQSATSPVLGSGITATDPEGPIISASKPTLQSDGTALADNDLWIDTSDIENYPTIYRYVVATQKWVLIDSTDQTTENGIVFADVRSGTSGGTSTTAPSGTIVELLTSDYVDFDAPDPALYPKGMLVWNLRRSGFNVKKFTQDYIDPFASNTRFIDEGTGLPQSMSTYYPHRWVSEAANQTNGAGTFGRLAQRIVVVQALQALINSNQSIRDEESKIFNLIAAPGYPEVIDEMVSLNYDRGITAFVVADTPARLAADATSLADWGASVELTLPEAAGSGSYDEYLGMFYPWGYTSDNLGNNIVVPPSHMMLRTISLSDNVSYPWFAPAGTRRGGITNATQVGYIDAEGEFVSVALNTGQRDTLSAIKVNPVTFISGSGLVNYGQFTRARNSSALDRINVARLVVYLRRRLSQLAKPYVFEPNDKITRDELKGAAENLLLELVGQRALYDYIVVCDETNNTPARIDRNELYLDIAIEPVKAVEFIYIPLRLKNTGEIKSLAGK